MKRAQKVTLVKKLPICGALERKKSSNQSVIGYIGLKNAHIA